MHPGVVEARLRHTLNSLGRRLGVAELYYFFGLLLHMPIIWDFLAADNKKRMEELLLQTNVDTVPRILPAALPISELEAACCKKIAELNGEQLGRLLEAAKHPLAVAHAVDLYCSAQSFDQANGRYNRVIEPILSELSQDQIRRILVAARVEGADLNGAHSFGAFTRHIYKHERIPRDEIITTLRQNSMDWVADRVEASVNAPKDEIPF